MLVKSAEGERFLISDYRTLIDLKLTIRCKVKCDDDQLSKLFPRRGRLFLRWGYDTQQRCRLTLPSLASSRREK